MKKVFVSILTNNSTPVQFQSRDIDLCQQSFSNSITYLVNDAANANDEILVVTGLSCNESALLYESLKNEIGEVCLACGARPQFIPVYIDSAQQDSLTYSEFFKSVSDVISDGDLLYADLTSEIAPLSFAMLIAFNYAVKACVDVRVSTAIYCHDADIIDVTALVHLLSITSDAMPQKKKEIDGLLSFLLGA